VAGGLFGVFAVTVVIQLVGVPVLLAGLFVLPGHLYAGDVVLGLLVGGSALAGVALLYRGLASAATALVAPTSAVIGAVVPVVVGLTAGERPGGLTLVGVVCALAATAMVTLGSGGGAATREAPDGAAHAARRPTPPDDSGRGAAPANATSRGVTARWGPVGLSVGCGLLFGVTFVLLARVHHDAGLIPLVVARFVPVVIAGVWLARRVARLLARRVLRGRSVRGAPSRPRPPAVPMSRIGQGLPAGLVVLAGVCDVVGTVGYLLALRVGQLSVVAPVGSLFPAATVTLAVVVDREPVGRGRLIGLVLAATALVLTAR
jgi:drug/metabolite transporter (DMT)-like permease